MTSILDRFSLKGRKALVTGGSMSIGRAIACGFADVGADVAIHYAAAADRACGLPRAADEVVQELKARNVAAHAIEGDLREIGAGHRIVAAACQVLDMVDILVVCASIQHRGPFETIPPTQIAEEVDINFRATVELMQAALPPMKERSWGRVLTIGSINQVRPDRELAVYAALKSAQANLCLNLARHYASHGVLINNLSPGLVATERNRWRREDAADWRRIEAEANPMRRAGLPEEMVGAALLFCSDAGSFIAGADLMVTGAGHLPL